MDQEAKSFETADTARRPAGPEEVSGRFGLERHAQEAERFAGRAITSAERQSYLNIAELLRALSALIGRHEGH